ncbi:golgin subfamily B member 1 isoform X6 [Peromyscus maniculatus bairdii]|uniref:golgin subfamily B member 1 isoform X6 n=1 Tax=Peromyscus maniculatus bairdii TaxID=230844 RepID=UPI003FD24FA2
MLSRLTGLANIVIHELSGNSADQSMTARLEAESDMELNNSISEDVLERLSDAEKLVVELKEIIRQKDLQLLQKDEALQEERKAADTKMKKIKLLSKAKITSLNKHIEELKAQGEAASPTDPQAVERLSEHDANSTDEETKGEEIKRDLQEKEKLISDLQAQLHQARAEQALQLEKSSAEMEEFVLMKQQLQEKEELIKTLQTQLSQTQAEQAAQLSSMQQVVREKDARFETQVRLHEDELLQLVTQADVETEMQQKLKVMQRKLEENEEALLGRAQVVDLLQQELTSAEQRNQNLSQQLQQLEAENSTLKNTMETERQESKILMEKVELEVAERKLSFHNLQEEMHHLQGQLEQAGQAQADLETQYSALEQKHKAEMEEKNAYISSIQKTEQELQSACAALKEENSILLREKDEQATESSRAIQQLQSACDALKEENSILLREKDEQATESSRAVQQLQSACDALKEENSGLLREKDEQATESSRAVQQLQSACDALKEENSILLREKDEQATESSRAIQQVQSASAALKEENSILLREKDEQATESSRAIQQLQSACDALKEENSILLREKDEQAAESAQAIQQLQSACDALKEENSILLREKDEQATESAQAIQQLQSACDALKEENSILLREKDEQATESSRAIQQVQSASAALKEENSILLREKDEQATESSRAIQQLQSACDALKEENSILLREKDEQAAESAQAIQQLQSACDALKEENSILLREKDEQATESSRAIQQVQSACDALKEENSILLREKDEQAAESAQAIQQLQSACDALKEENSILLREKDEQATESAQAIQQLQSACDALKEENSGLLREKDEQAAESAQAIQQLQSACDALKEENSILLREKDEQATESSRAIQQVQSACDALKEENSELLREKDEQAVESAHAIQQLEDQLQQKSKEISQFVNKPNLQKHETASQTSLPDAYNEGIQAVTEEKIASLQKRVVELENEKGALLHGSVELEELKAKNEKLSSRITFLEAQNRAGEADGAVCEVNTAGVTVVSKSNSSTEESGQDVLENTLSQKHKELAVLLVEMKEAHDEIAFLKSQLQGKRPDGDPEVLDQTEVKLIGREGAPSVTAGDIPLVPNEESGIPGAAKEEPASTEDQHPTSEAGSANDAAVGLNSTKLHGVDKSPSLSDACQCHQDELESLKSKIMELETSLHKAEEMSKINLDEKAREISSLTQLVEQLRKSAEDAHSALTTVSEERDQLLSRVDELSVLAELRAQVRELEGSLATAEKQRALDYESQKTQHNLLTEQIHSLTIEAKSKNVKMEALQRELDDVQLQCSEQATQIKSLQSQLQTKETEVLEGAEHMKAISKKMEGLSQALSQKELEIAKMERDMETLQQTIQEKEQQVTDLSYSMTEKMVQLNEEKFSLGVEIKTLKEQLNSLSRAEEAKKGQAQENHGVVSSPGQAVSGPAGLSKEELQRELELLKKESDQRKRKLHAALLHRKELLQKVSTLEEALAQAREESSKEVARGVGERTKLEEDRENKDGPEKCGASKCRELEASLKETIAEKEVELERVRRDLEDKTAAGEQLQAVVQQMSQNLQDQSKQIDLLQAEIVTNEATIQKLTPGAPDAGDGDSAAPLKEPVVSGPPSAGDGKHWKPELEGKIADLEKEKEQLEKRLYKALSSYKAILKKAQERERHLKDELGKQEDANNHLQEQLTEQSKENENIGGQLRQLQTKTSEEVLLLQKEINKQGLEIQNWKATSHEAEAHAESLQEELERSQVQLAGLEHLKTLQPKLDDLQEHVRQKQEEVSYLSGQLGEKEQTLSKVQAEMVEQEHLIKALHTQLEMQAKEHEERLKQFQVELCELKQKSEEAGEEAKVKQQIQRKLQAALISRKEALKENKSLQEELSSARAAVDHLTKSLADVESQVSVQKKEKEAFLGKLALLQEERDKLIVEMDKSLLENQNLGGSCESLKRALEGLTEDREKLVRDLESLRCLKMAESTEWHEKHQELQKEYEVLLQSYENVSNEAERMQHVVEGVRKEKQELYGKLRGMEAGKREAEKRLQDAEQEMEEMREKMRKFARSKQQKILELEEENERLRAEAQPVEGARESMEALLSSNSSLKEDLEKVTSEHKTLSKEFEALMAEREILSEEIRGLKHQVEDGVLKQASLEDTEKSDEQKDVTEEVKQAMVGKSQEQESQSVHVQLDDSEGILSVNSAEPGISETFSSHDDISNYLQQLDQLKGRIAELEVEKRSDRELSQTLENEKNALLNQISAKDGELKLLGEEVTKINMLNQQIQEELSRVTKLKEMAEEEKDDLEERLMNQLAELNGSIGNYYQDVTDAQIKNEQLECEMQNLKKCMSNLKKENQQLVKEKTKVESEIRKEYLEKIQGAQKEPGNKIHAKELQELLKEKQQEVRQLQKDCIRYQERISALEKTVKALEFVQTESQKDLDATKGNLAQAVEHHRTAQAELSSIKVLLDDTQSEAARVLADNLKLKKELQSNKEAVKSQMKQKDDELARRLEQAEERHLEEKKSMQEKLDALHGEKAHVEEMLVEMQATLSRKDQDMKQLQEGLDSTVAQLAAFTKSMSSLQDDRDRVIDEAKKWERKFGDAILTKEEEIRLKEENCITLKDQLQQMTIHTEELKINISRLEHDKEMWESKAQTELQDQQKFCDTLQRDNKNLMSQLEETRQLYHNSLNELAKLESELKHLNDKSTDLNSSLEKCREHKENLEGIIKQQEADIQNCKFSYEQLETDLKASRELTRRLDDEIKTKEQKIISLLSSKDEAIQVAVAELQQQHQKEIKELENLLSQEEEENVALEEENKKAIEKTNQLMETLGNVKKENLDQKAHLDSFIKSMSSLQNDRDRILSDYQQLEDRHLSVILEKDQLIQDAAAENNKLKEEIRGLRSHLDDLNSENAKLDAELIQYRQDLNEVISIKDCQQKQLLEAQLQKNQELKNECTKLEEKLKGSEEARQILQRSSEALQEEKRALSTEVEGLKRHVAALQEEGTLGAQLKVKEEEVQRLNVALSSYQKRTADLEEELICVQKEATQKVSEIEDKLKKELKHLHHDAGIMRNETETAEERVAELARDLVEMEQKLLTVTKENQDLTAQIQSFRGSMSSLQDSRDHATEELGDLKKKYDASLKELAQLKEQTDLSRESDILPQAALPLTTTENSLPRLEKLDQQLISKDQQLLSLSSQLEESHNKMQTFSKAMTSLQHERDHLWNELEKFRKSEEGKQRAVAPSPASSPAEMQSLKKAMSSLQNDRDRLLQELKNLQQQYLQMNEEVVELRPLKAQLEEHQEQTKSLQTMNEQFRQEKLAWQHELHQLRMEKNAWEHHERRMKEHNIMAFSDNNQQNLPRPSSQPQILPSQHQRQFSQLLEEKNTLAIQLSDTSQSLRENQHHYSELFKHCAVLEKQVQELQAGSPTVDVAPGAPQGKNRTCKKSNPEATREPQPSFSKAQEQLCSTKQEVKELKKLLEEERDQRLAAESALSLAEEQIRRLEQSEWESARTPIIGACGSQETSVLIDIPDSSYRRTRSGVGWKRVLRSLCHSRTRAPLLAAIYFLMVHVILILCLTGYL